MLKYYVSLLVLSWVFAVSFIPTPALAYKLPDTGQSQCYDPVSNDIITCPASGAANAQDGSYSLHPMSYTDHGAGTVTDNNTGLMWEKLTTLTTYNWQGSVDYCSTASTGGLGGWRLPTKKELLTIVDYSVPPPNTYDLPTINTFYFPNTVRNWYWTATEAVPSGGSNAWYINFITGVTGSTVKAQYLNVRCVRGSVLPEPTFFDHGNGTVTDLNTGLMWTQDETGQSTWAEALSYCNDPAVTGVYSDWRLPNIKEMESISNDTLYSVSSQIAIDKNFFPAAIPSYYWSSTTFVNDPTQAWDVYFSYGFADNSAKTSAGSHYIRCVRGGEFGSGVILNINGASAMSTVTSSPSGINCGATCSFLYPINTVVNLSIVPGVGTPGNWPYFFGWTGDAGCDTGMVTMDISKGCTEHMISCGNDFIAYLGSDQVTPVRDTITHAYSDAQTSDTISLVAVHTEETINFDVGKDILLIGGLSCGIILPGYPYTFISGSITISNGSVTTDGIIIM